MHSNELTDFIQACQATHSYTDEQVYKYFSRLADKLTPEAMQTALNAMRAYRPRVFNAVLRTMSDDGTG